MRKRIQKHPVPCGVGFADLNGLKYVNDTFGHEYGDKVLVRLAEVMKQYFPEDQIYRISGDEFIVLCLEIEQEMFLNLAETLNNRLKQEENGLAAFEYVWDDGKKDIAELLRLAHQPQSLAVPFRIGHAEVALEVLLQRFALPGKCLFIRSCKDWFAQC